MLKTELNRVVAAVLLLCVLTTVCDAVTPLARIKTRPGSPYAEFYNSQTGEVFYPMGSSYVKLHWIGSDPYHSTFIPALYDANDAEEALSIMAQSGHTVVRVWIFMGASALRTQSPPLYSVEGTSYSATGPELYQPYMDNVVDFIERPNRHGIYVQLVIDRTPANSYYQTRVNSGFSDVTGSINREYMVSGAVEAKQIYIRQLIQNIIDRNPNLLSTIFAYEIRNEVHSRSDEKPFSLSSGVVSTGNGQTYDMANAASRQACQDENILYWLNQCVAAVREKDFEALTTCSVFGFSSVGKSGLAGGGLLPLTTSDKRWPILPGVLVESDIDFVDMHGYLPYDSWNTILNSSLWPSIDKTLKPFTCGEFGALRTSYPNVYSAADALYNFRETILDSGFHGGLLFTWDTYSHIRWTMMEDGAIINERLKPEQWSNWQFDTDGFTQFWNTGQSVSNFDAQSGSLQFDISGTDAYIYSPLTRLDSDAYRYFTIRLKNNTAGTTAQVLWTTKTATTWSQTRSITFDIVPNSSEFKTYVVDLYENSNWSGLAKQFRFYPVNNEVSSGSYAIDYVQVLRATASEAAYNPVPADGASDVSVWPQYSWSEGFSAVSHKLYLSDDESAVVNRTVPPIETIEPGYASSDTLAFGARYYWAVDEVTCAATTIPGQVWSFTTADTAVVEPMGYDDDADLQAVWTGSPHLPGCTTDNRMRMPYYDAANTYTRLLGEDAAGLDFSPAVQVRYVLRLEGLSGVSVENYPQWTLQLLDASDTVLCALDSSSCDTDVLEAAASSDQIIKYDISAVSGTLGAVRKIRFVVEGYPDILSDYGIVIDAIAIAGITCDNPPAWDVNNDCVVDLEDFAILASIWLECGLYPASACP